MMKSLIRKFWDRESKSSTEEKKVNSDDLDFMYYRKLEDDLDFMYYRKLEDDFCFEEEIYYPEIDPKDISLHDLFFKIKSLHPAKHKLPSLTFKCFTLKFYSGYFVGDTSQCLLFIDDVRVLDQKFTVEYGVQVLSCKEEFLPYIKFFDDYITNITEKKEAEKRERDRNKVLSAIRDNQCKR